MAIEVFNRYENKYRLDPDTFAKIQSQLSLYMEPDQYNKDGNIYTISNLYYDTPDHHLIRTSLQKPKYKEKLRLRAYGVPDKDTKVYVEMKKKFNGLVNKRRSALKLEEAYSFLASNHIPEEQPYQNRQVLHELSAMLEANPLSPALYLAYDRKAYFGRGQEDLRISFDTNIRTRRYDLALEAGDYGEALLKEEYWLMEIKVAQSIPLWLSRLLSEHQIFPKSFSKYGEEYRQLIETRPTQDAHAKIREGASESSALSRCFSTGLLNNKKAGEPA